MAFGLRSIMSLLDELVDWIRILKMLEHHYFPGQVW